MMEWDYISELRPPPGPLFISWVICERGEPWWWWCRLGKTPDSSTRALWQFYQERHLGQLGGMDEGVRILPFQYLRYIKGPLKRCKILGHGTSGFTSLPKEGLLRIIISLKNPSPRPSLNPRPLGPVASRLTTASPRRHCVPFVRLTKVSSTAHVHLVGCELGNRRMPHRHAISFRSHAAHRAVFL
jgi:hypothetical protein